MRSAPGIVIQSVAPLTANGRANSPVDSALSSVLVRGLDSDDGHEKHKALTMSRLLRVGRTQGCGKASCPPQLAAGARWQPPAVPDLPPARRPSSVLLAKAPVPSAVALCTPTAVRLYRASQSDKPARPRPCRCCVPGHGADWLRPARLALRRLPRLLHVRRLYVRMAVRCSADWGVGASEVGSLRRRYERRPCQAPAAID